MREEEISSLASLHFTPLNSFFIDFAEKFGKL